MKQIRLILAAAPFFMLLSLPVLSHDKLPETRSRLDKLEKLTAAILAAEEPSAARDRFGALFKSISADEIRRLQKAASDTIAIQCAWEEVERTVPKECPQSVCPEHDKLARFLGFLEGRARVNVPSWWSEAILDARANRRGNIYAGGLNLKFPLPHADQGPRFAKFEKQNGKSAVRFGSSITVIPDDLENRLEVGAFDQVSALITASACYVAAFDSLGSPYRLACVDRFSGKIRWVSKVWASWWGGSASGGNRQLLEITEQDNRVIVFGTEATGLHVEGFDVTDGRNVFRFSNSYSR